MRILVTGAAGCVARVLLPRLCNSQFVVSVIGIDVRPITFKHEKLQSHITDIRSTKLDILFQQIDVVIHLAFIVQSGDLKIDRNNLNLIRDININGTINVVQSAHRLSIKHIVYLSSAIIYGGALNRSIFYDENHAIQAVVGLPYSEHKVELEKWLDQFQSKHATPTITRLRPHMILGRHAQPLLKKIILSAWLPKLPEPEPLIQGVWEEDVVTAIICSMQHSSNTSFNLSANQAATVRELKSCHHRHLITLPFSLARQCHRLSWFFTGSLGDPNWFTVFNRQFCLNNDKINDQLGWQPSLSLSDCVKTLHN